MGDTKRIPIRYWGDFEHLDKPAAEWSDEELTVTGKFITRMWEKYGQEMAKEWIRENVPSCYYPLLKELVAKNRQPTATIH